MTRLLTTDLRRTGYSTLALAALLFGMGIAPKAEVSEPALVVQPTPLDDAMWLEIATGEPMDFINRIYTAVDKRLEMSCSGVFYPTKDSVFAERDGSRRGQLCGAYYGCRAVNRNIYGEWVRWDCLNDERPADLYSPDPEKTAVWLEEFCTSDEGWKDDIQGCKDEMRGSCPIEVCLSDEDRAKVRARGLP